MPWTRQILGVMSVIIAQLVFGGISLSLGLMALALLAGVAVLAVAALALCGLSFVLEKIGWVPQGFTDRKLHALKAWAKGSPGKINHWKNNIKKDIIEYLDEKEDTVENHLSSQIKKLQVIVIMEAIVIAMLTAMQIFKLSLRGSAMMVAAGCVIITVGVIYFTNVEEEPETGALEAADQESDKKEISTDGPTGV